MLLATLWFASLTRSTLPQVTYVHYLRGGTRLLVAEGEVFGNGQAKGQIFVFDLRTGKKIRTITTGAQIEPIAVSGDERFMAVGGDNFQPVTVYETKTGRKIRTLEADLNDHRGSAFLPGGKTLVLLASARYAEYGHLEAQTCTLPNGEPRKLIASDGARQTAIDAKGKWLAIVTAETEISNQAFPMTTHYALKIYSAPSGALEQVLAVGERIADLCFTPDGKHLAARKGTGQISFWNTSNWRGERSLTSPSTYQNFQPRASEMTFSPKGDRLLVGLDGLGVAIYDLRHNRRRTIYTPARTLWRSIDVSPDGKQFAVGSTDGSIEIRDIQTGLVLKSWRPQPF